MRTERMPDPADLMPGAADALDALEAAVAAAGVDGRLLALSRLRASQINGCGADHLPAVAAWRETPGYSDEERAALALAEAVTRIADQADPVPDRIWDVAATHFDHRELAALLLAVALTNATDRLNTSIRRQAGNQRG